MPEFAEREVARIKTAAIWPLFLFWFWLYTFVALFDFTHDIVDVLTMTFARVEEKFEVGDALETSVFFEELAHLSRTAFKEYEGVSFTTVRDSGKENNRALEIWRNIHAGDGDERIGIGFLLNEASGSLLDDIADATLAF